MEIHKYPDPVLRKVAVPLERIDDDVRAKARQMAALMYKDKGVGLAAPQVGWSVRLIVVNPTGKPEDEKVYVNPRVVWKSRDKARANEGCLSLPDINGKIERPVAIKLEAQDLSGAALELDLAEFPARVVQHEVDHLDGVLIIDRMSLAEKTIAEPRLRDMIRERDKREAATAGAKPARSARG